MNNTNVEVRAYQKPRRRVFGVPIPAILALVMAASIVAAVVVFLGPPSAVVTQTPKAIYAQSGTGAEPAYGQIESTLGYQSIDHVVITAYQAGYSGSQAIHVQVQIGGVTPWANAGTLLPDPNGGAGPNSL